MPVDALYEQAGLRIDEEEQTPAVVEAIRADPQLTGRQRQAMLEVYRSFTAQAHPPRRGGGRSRSGG